MNRHDDPVDYDSPRAIPTLLTEQGIALKKRWGQNFMVNRGARERIVELLSPGSDETVWEVGPGLGAMTVLLSPRAARLILFEIDWALIRILQERFSADRRVTIVPGDAVTTWRQVYAQNGLPAALFGNLPYSSAAMLVGSLLESGVVPGRMVFTVQREVARRMQAAAGSPDYSGFSALCQAYCSVRVAGDLQPGSFFPPPEVVSTIVMFDRLRSVGVRDPSLHAKLVRAAFASRRKTLQNNLFSSSIAKERGKEALRTACESAQVDLSDRAERISPRAFVELSNALSRLSRNGPAQ